MTILYTSDSQPGVRVPPGVRTRTFRGKRKKKLNNGGKRHIRQQLQFTVTTYKFETTATILITNILLIRKRQFMEIGCQWVRKWKKGW